MGKMQKYLAEALGTFTLVVGGSFAIISAAGAGGAGIVSIALGFGLALLIGLYAFGEVSGGHFNPAVSLAMFMERRLSMDDLIGYWVAQFAGAIGASLVVLVAFFVAVILQVTRSGTYSRQALTVIPLALVGIHVAAIPISGSSVNPARSLGPALIGTEFGDFWIYLVAPAIGAVLGWIAHKIVAQGDMNLRDDLEAMRGGASA